MAPKPKPKPKSTDEDPANVKWTDPEVLAMLSGLSDRKDTHQSGNGWKPTVWADIVKAVQAIDPQARPAKDQTKLVSKLKYLKDLFELYLYVEKYSGSGWDDEKKLCCNTDDYIADFIATHGKKYATCFKRPCPFYKELNDLYDGLKNRATGEHVVHLGQPKKRAPRRKSDKENPTAAGPSSVTNTVPAVDPEGRAPMVALSTVPNVGDFTEGSQDLYADELTTSPPKSRKRTRAESDEEVEEDADDKKGKRRRHKSDSSNGSVARRNAEAGTQLARSVDNLSVAMAKPIVTTEDISFVDDVMKILADPTLLPPDPDGALFDIVSTALTSSPTRAHIFILAPDDVRRKAIIKRILKDAGFDIPDDY